MFAYVIFVAAASFTYAWLNSALAPLCAVLRAAPHVPRQSLLTAFSCAAGITLIGIVIPAAVVLIAAQAAPALALSVLSAGVLDSAFRAGAALWVARVLFVGPPRVDGDTQIAAALALPSIAAPDQTSLSARRGIYLRVVRAAPVEAAAIARADHELSTLSYTAVSGR